MQFNKSIKILISINLLFVFGAALLGPLYAVFVEKIGGNILTVGWSFSVFMAAGGIVSLISGKLLDRIKEKEYLIAVGYFTRFIGFLAYIFVTTPIHLLFVQVILGFGESIQAPAFKSVFSAHLDKNIRGVEWGLWDGSFKLVIAISTIVGALIAHFFGFNILFLIMSLISLLSFVLLMIQPRKLL